MATSLQNPGGVRASNGNAGAGRIGGPAARGSTQYNDMQVGFPDATAQTATGTNWGEAVSRYFGAPDLQDPQARDSLAFTDKSVLELFDQRPNATLTWWLRDNFEQADSSWHFLFAPITKSEGLQHRDHYVTVNRTMMSLAAPQAVPDFVSQKTESHLTVLRRHIKGLEIDGEAFANYKEGNQSFYLYVLAVTTASLLTAKANVIARLLGSKSYFIEWRRRFGESHQAASPQEALALEIATFGTYSHDVKAFYKSRSEAQSIGATENTRYNMLVVPSGRLDTLAFSAFESDRADVRGEAKMQSRLVQAGESMRVDMPGYTIHEDMIFVLEDQAPFELTLMQTYAARWLPLNAARYNRDTANFNATAAGRVAFMNVDADSWDRLTVDDAERASIYFDHDGAGGDGVSNDVQRFGDGFEAWMRELGLRLPESNTTHYIHPYLWYDESTGRHHRTVQNGQRQLESADLEHAILHGRTLAKKLAESGAVSADDRRAMQTAFSFLASWFNVSPTEFRSDTAQGWLAAVTLKNRPAGTPASSRSLTPSLNRYGGLDLPDTAQRADGVWVLGVQTATGFRAVVRQDGDTVSYTLGGAGAGDGNVAVPPTPYGFSTAPQMLTLADFYRFNASSLAGYASWEDNLKRIAAAWDPLQRLFAAVRPIYSQNPSMDASRVPFYYDGSGDSSDKALTLFVAANMDSGAAKQPLLVAFTPLDDPDNGIVGIGGGASAGGAFTGAQLNNFGVSDDDAAVRGRSAAVNQNLATLLRSNLLSADLTDAVSRAQDDDVAADALAAVWARYAEGSEMQSSYRTYRNSSGTLSPSEFEAVGTLGALLVSEARLDTDPAQFAASRDLTRQAGNFVSAVYNVLERTGGRMSLNAQSIADLRQSPARGAAASGDVLDDEDAGVQYVVTPLAVAASAFGGITGADVLARIVAQPSDPNNVLRPLVGANVAPDEAAARFRGAGANADGGGARTWEQRGQLLSVGRNGGFTTSLDSLQLPSAVGAAPLSPPNRWTLLRYARILEEPDALVRLGATLWLESPVSLSQRARFFRAGLALESNYVFLQTDGDFWMGPDMHLVQGAGKLLYSMAAAHLSYNKVRDKFTGRFAIWMESNPGYYANSLLLPNRHHIRYQGGFGKSLYTPDDRVDYQPSAPPDMVASQRDTFTIDLGAVTSDDDIGEWFSMQGRWDQRYFMQTFQGMQENTVHWPWLLYPMWYWQWTKRNELQNPAYDSYADVRDNVLLAVNAGRGVVKEWVPGTAAEYRQRKPGRSVLKDKVAPGCLGVYNGNGDMLRSESDQPYYM